MLWMDGFPFRSCRCCRCLCCRCRCRCCCCLPSFVVRKRLLVRVVVSIEVTTPYCVLLSLSRPYRCIFVCLMRNNYWTVVYGRELMMLKIKACGESKKNMRFTCRKVRRALLFCMFRTRFMQKVRRALLFLHTTSKIQKQLDNYFVFFTADVLCHLTSSLLYIHRITFFTIVASFLLFF